MSITLFGKEIPLYSLFFFLGIIVAGIIAVFLIKKRKIHVFDFVCAAVYVMIGAILGAKLLFVVVSWKTIMQLQLSFIEVIKGGFVFYGGLIGGAIGLFIHGKQFKLDIKTYADIFAVVLPIGHALGRVGCFLAGCCYGIPYDGIGSYTYTHSHNVFTPIGIPLLPVQLIEAFLLSVLFTILIITFFKTEKTGIVTASYVTYYAIMRFILEFFRGDRERGLLLHLSTSQWISIALMITMIVISARHLRNEENSLFVDDK